LPNHAIAAVTKAAFPVFSVGWMTGAKRDWCRFNSTGSLFMDPGSPWQNAWIESFNGRLRRFLRGQLQRVQELPGVDHQLLQLHETHGRSLFGTADEGGPSRTTDAIAQRSRIGEAASRRTFFRDPSHEGH